MMMVEGVELQSKSVTLSSEFCGLFRGRMKSVSKRFRGYFYSGQLGQLGNSENSGDSDNRVWCPPSRCPSVVTAESSSECGDNREG